MCVVRWLARQNSTAGVSVHIPAGQNTSPSATLKTQTFLWNFNYRKSGRPDNTAYVGSCDKQVSKKSISPPGILNFLWNRMRINQGANEKQATTKIRRYVDHFQIKRNMDLLQDFVRGKPSVENQLGGRRNKSFVCMCSRNCIIDIITDYSNHYSY